MDDIHVFMQYLTEMNPATNLKRYELPKIPLIGLEIKIDDVFVVIEYVTGSSTSLFIPRKAFGVSVQYPDDTPFEWFFSYAHDIEFDTYDEMKNYVISIIDNIETT